MRRAAKVDANHGDIVAALRRCGAAVQSLASVGMGCPDLLVAFRGEWYLLEVKDGGKAESKQKLTPDEVSWHGEFGRHATVDVVRSVDDALMAIGAVAGVRV